MTKLSELFAYENIVNNKTCRAKHLLWNNKTFLIAEENSTAFYDDNLTFDEMIECALQQDEQVINLLLFSAMMNAYDGFDHQEFVDYFEPEEFDLYSIAVLDGLLHYLPEPQQRKQLPFAVDENENEIIEYDQWATMYFFCKKYLLMSDEEFLNSTWRKITILQKEFMKTMPKNENNVEEPKFIDEVNLFGD